MTQKNDPFIGSNWGWDEGEDGWGLGLNENLIQNAFLHNKRIDGVVASLPLSPTDGDAYFLTSDNNVYFRAEGVWYNSLVPVGMELILKSDESVLQFDGSSLVTLPDLETELENKVDKVIGKQLSTEDYTSEEKTKLAGIAEGATANSTDASLRDRATHTGVQDQSTITDLVADLAAKQSVANLVQNLSSPSSSTYLSTQALSEAFADVTAGESYQGEWDASTNTPALASGVGTQGYYYQVSVAGTTTLDGISTWALGDEALFDGTVWVKRANYQSVTSVNGLTGPVVLSTSNIAEGTNLYHTGPRVRAVPLAGFVPSAGPYLITAADTVISAFQKIQGRLNTLGTASTAAVTTSATDTTSGSLWRTDDLVKTTSSTDTTAGRMLKVGDFGVGDAIVSIETNANNYTTPGVFFTPASGLVNFPAAISGSERVIVIVSGGAGGIRQDVVQRDSNRFFSRVSPSTSMSGIPWVEGYSTSNTSTDVQAMLSAANNAAIRTAIGVGDGTGTVTSVSMTVPTGLAITGSPITSSGTLALGLQSGYSIPTTVKQGEWDTAYTDRATWNGGSTGLVAATGRTSLGLGNTATLTASTDVLTMLGAANNTAIRTAIGAGTGNGTVTSVGITAPTGISVMDSPVTGSGTLALSYTAGYSIPTTAKQTQWDTAWSDRNNWDGNASVLSAALGRTSLGLGTAATATTTVTTTDTTVGRVLTVGWMGLGGGAVSTTDFNSPTPGNLFLSGSGTPTTNVPFGGWNVGLQLSRTSSTSESAQIVIGTSGDDGLWFRSRYNVTEGVYNPWRRVWDTGNTSANVQTMLSAANNAAIRSAIGAGTGNGSVTSVGMTVPTGLTVSGSPITSSGTFAVTLTSGYSIPTTANQTNWSTAFTQTRQWDGGTTGLVASTGRDSLDVAQKGMVTVETNTSTSLSGVFEEHRNRYFRSTAATDTTVTIQANTTSAVSIGASFVFKRVSAGTLTFVPAVGVTVNPPYGGTLVLEQGMIVTLVKVGTNEWDLMGQTVAA